ncbi:MAG TPA: ABC transporter permease [Gaiellaceae bacterium]|nr:ABC transporter permease [Gaiellaceae bacterium]
MDDGVETGAAAEPEAESGTPSRGPWRRAARRYARRPLGVVALVVLAVVVLAGVLGGRLATYPVNHLDLAHVNQAQGPTLAGRHWFGTDYLGRDLLSQVLYGLHTSILVALMVAVVATALGVLVGAVTGYAGGWLDSVLMGGVDLIVTIPVLAALLASIVYFSPLTPTRIGIVLMLLMWTTVARVVRSNFAVLQHREFVEAAHAAGASPTRIVFRHLLPNSIGTIIVAATSVFGLALVLEATADFFNVGTSQVSGPTLGNLIADSTKYGNIGSAPWWTWTMPALVLVVLLVCVNFVGDSLDDAFGATG